VWYLASVRFASPNVFDCDGNSYSFNEEQWGIVPMLGSHFWVQAILGYDNDKKYLSSNNVMQHQTTLFIVAARLIESIGNGRFIVARARVHKANRYEVEQIVAHTEVRNLLSLWEVRRVTNVYIGLWSEPGLLNATRVKARVNFDKMAAHLASILTELGIRKETVEENWARTMTDIERVGRRQQPPPMVLPQHQEDKR
jgi:hypothetical protein